jgi:cell division protein FtsW (lipid II flippase)
MWQRYGRTYRRVEGFLLLLVLLIAGLGFSLVGMAARVQEGVDPLNGLLLDLFPLLLVAILLAGLHVLLNLRRSSADQLLLPLMAMILSIGLTMIWRLRGSEGVWQQVLRGFLPGALLLGALIAYPQAVERIRRWAIPIAGLGLLLAFATALFGQVDETGARLSLKLGPLPAIQASEIIKLVLIVFLAWFIDREGEEVEGRARPFLGFLRVPALRYFVPGVLFVTMATLALVEMSDFGAVPILALIFVLMLFSGFDTRTFATIAAIGLALAVMVGVVLAFTWTAPAHIQYRILAFQDPWSTEEIMFLGEPTGLTVAEGPGYQIQQAIYAIIAGGVTGAGLGYGSPQNIPLVSTDFIYAAVLEELGAVVGIALLIFYILLVLRILRNAALLPRALVFERLLLAGIGIHFFTQVFVMVGGTLNLIPMTGVTIPFLSLGGSALLTNLVEIGLVLSISQRLEV